MKCDGGLGNLMDKLDDIAKVLDRKLMKDIGLDFPEIAVVGQQATGKSSVLERITVRVSALQYCLFFCLKHIILFTDASSLSTGP
jgi:50S ribosomal subunit-associated GTPase HflX